MGDLGNGGIGDWESGMGKREKLDESDPFDYWGRALKASAGEGVQPRFYNGTMRTNRGIHQDGVRRLG
jgi:hypothetical protein